MAKFLILGGTAEGVHVSKVVSKLSGMDTVYSLSGATKSSKSSKLPNCRTRIGGFGGVEGLLQYLGKEKFDGLVDATHPYASQMANHAALACQESNIPRIKFVRPAWIKVSGDDWRGAQNLEEAPKVIPEIAQRIFLATGRKDLPVFESLSERWFLVRLVDAPKAEISLDKHQLILGRGPFDLESEIELLKMHKIDVVVSKNSGGSTYAKIEAARNLGLPVIMIDRPKPPKGLVVGSLGRIKNWVKKITSAV
jgi:precorrin-6A/cobalt-precorrin-6A reductase